MAKSSAGGKREPGLRPLRQRDGYSLRSPREATSSSLRVSGLGVLQDFLCNPNVFASPVPVTGSFLDGADVTSRLLNMHNAVASRNVEAAKRLENSEPGDDDGRVGSNWPASHRKGPCTKQNSAADRQRGSIFASRTSATGKDSSVVEEDPFAAIGGTVEIDLQALSAEFDSVSAALRVMLSENPSANQFSLARQIKPENEPADEDDGEDEEDEKKKRILRYRFVRKIEDPPPPLQGLDELPPEKHIFTDKIERNKRHTFLSWSRGIKERTLQRNQAKAERATVARQRREQVEASHQERMAERFAQLESITNSRSKAELQGRLVEKTAQRNNRFWEAQQRREENEAKRLEKLQTEFEGRLVRSIASSAPAPGHKGYAVAPSGVSSAAAASSQVTLVAAQVQQASSATAPSVAALAADTATAGGEVTASDAPSGLTIFELFCWDDLDEEKRIAKQKDRIPEEEAAEAEEQFVNASSQDTGSAGGEPAEAGDQVGRDATTTIVAQV